MKKFNYKKIFKKAFLITLSVFIVVITAGYCLPYKKHIPVENASKKDYHPDSFWYYPWGKSGTHKGVDIFAAEGTNVLASTYGYILATGKSEMGGNYVIIAGPKWLYHYYAHLKTINTTTGSFVSAGDKIGTVGTTGNAKGKPAHLHYSIVSKFPKFWKIDNSPQGWKKMFFMNPIEYIED